MDSHHQPKQARGPQAPKPAAAQQHHQSLLANILAPPAHRINQHPNHFNNVCSPAVRGDRLSFNLPRSGQNSLLAGVASGSAPNNKPFRSQFAPQAKNYNSAHQTGSLLSGLSMAASQQPLESQDVSPPEDVPSDDQHLKPISFRSRFDSTASNSILSCDGGFSVQADQHACSASTSSSHDSKFKQSFFLGDSKKRIEVPKPSKQSAFCINCDNRFRPATMHLDGKLCANCFKIYQSIERTCEQHDGSFKLKERGRGKVEVVITCSKDHKWQVPMHSRKAKNWCRQCKDLDREEATRIQIQRINEIRQRQTELQEALFQDPGIRDPGDDVGSPAEDPVDQNIRRLLLVELVQNNANPLENPQLQNEITDLFLNVDRERIVAFLQGIEDGHPANAEGPSPLRQLVQRLRLCLHPDKNRFHPRAGEAFSRMTFITQRIRYKDKQRCPLSESSRWRALVLLAQALSSLLIVLQAAAARSMIGFAAAALNSSLPASNSISQRRQHFFAARFGVISRTLDQQTQMVMAA